MGKRLTKQWFQRPVLEVAPELLGANLVVNLGDVQPSRYRITEVEAYDGEQDLACHASRGRTLRTEVMYQPGGVFYVYLVYGMYWMLNIVTGEKDYPAAVLIRGVEGVNGPGKLTRDLGIGRTLNGLSATPQTGLWFEEGSSVVKGTEIKTTPRVGVAYASEWAKAPYRFLFK